MPSRIALIFVVVALNVRSALGAPTTNQLEQFEKKIRPLLAEHCWKCHSAEMAKGGLRLDLATALMKGGKSGPVVVPGKPDASRLIAAVRHEGTLKMPQGGKLTNGQIVDLVEWIQMGAHWPETAATAFTADQRTFWSFQPVREQSPPKVKRTDWIKSPIDRFIMAKMEALGIQPAVQADRETLIRRVTFDLTGLPPTLDEIDAFLRESAISSDAAYTMLIDRLLKSPHYGERWARHWLDVARYAESTANDANAVMRYAWRYRDYVVESFNRDLPYDQFVVEQLAGDLLPLGNDKKENARHVIATGFLMLGPKALAETDKEQVRMDVADEQINVVSRAFLGLTVGCARCHDHKFDPIPTADYYGLAGIFRSTEVFRDDVPNAAFWQEWPLPEFNSKPLIVMAPKEGKPADLKIHLRGNRFTLGETTPRHFPRIVAGIEQPNLPANLSGRLELAHWIASKNNPLTARVMVNRIWQHHFGTGLVATSDNLGFRGDRPSHPELLDWLAARFIESGWSVKAMHRLILKSATCQQAASVPQSEIRNPKLLDPDNRLLWKMPRRRLDAESIRDAMLAISGKLDRTIGGDDSGEFLYKEGEVIDKKRDFFRPNQVKADHPFYASFTKRSIYLPVVRNALPDVLTVFDAADPYAVTAVRNETTVPAQALFLLNNPFVRDQSTHFAKRLLDDAKATDGERIQKAYRLALGRMPRDGEIKDAVEFVSRYTQLATAKGKSAVETRVAAWGSFCQSLLCRNEFSYVE